MTVPGGATGSLDLALKGAIREIIANGDIRGKLGEVGIIYPRGEIPAKRVLIVGLGPLHSLDLETVRQASSFAMKKARELNAKNVATIVHGAGIGGLDVSDAAQAVGEGSILGLYKTPKRYPEPWDTIETITFVEVDPQKIRPIEEGAKVAQYTR